MKRTLLSSLLFFYPINVAYNHRDKMMVNVMTGALVASMTNHSHTFHQDDTRRRIFGWIDQKYMMGMTLLIAYRCIKKSPTLQCIARVGGNVLLISFIYFYLLNGYQQRQRSIESYDEKQKYIHMAMHFIAIVGLTNAYKTYYYLDYKK